MRIDKFVLFFVFLGLTLSVQSQNIGLSSYSRIGVGDLAEQGSSRNTGMGGAGVASYHQFQLNALNPAALAVLKYTNFEFDIAGKRTKYITSKEGSQTGASGNIQHISLAFPLHKRFVVQLGAKPFSSVAYYEGDYQSALDKDNNPAGTKYYNYTYNGSGGLSDIFLGCAYNYKDWLMAGINGGIVTGQSVYENTITEAGSRFTNTTARFEQHLRISPGLLITREIKNNKADLILTDSLLQNKDSLNGKKAEVVPVNDNWFYGLGITASFFNKLQAQELQTFEQLTYVGSNSYYRRVDTLISGSISGYSLPASFRAGISIYKPNKINFVLDYTFAKWSNYTHNQYKSKSRDQHGIAFGTEYIPDYNSIKYYKRVAYRAGVSAGMLPYEIQGQSITQLQASVGAGLVFPKTGVTLNLSLAYGQRGTTTANLVKENYWLATVGIISNNKWFIRRRHE